MNYHRLTRDIVPKELQKMSATSDFPLKRSLVGSAHIQDSFQAHGIPWSKHPICLAALHFSSVHHVKFNKGLECVFGFRITVLCNFNLHLFYELVCLEPLSISAHQNIIAEVIKVSFTSSLFVRPYVSNKFGLSREGKSNYIPKSRLVGVGT